jgi:asparagine synthetase B (glutamine-hydrolysing)
MLRLWIYAVLSCRVFLDVTACSFLVTNEVLNESQLLRVNEPLVPRGPDKTNFVFEHGWSFVHNILHLTGKMTVQPFTYNVQPEQKNVTLCCVQW